MILFQRQQRATQQCWACYVQKTHLNVQTALGQVQTQVLRRKHREAWSHLLQPIKPPGCSHREPLGGTSSFHAVCSVFRHRPPNNHVWVEHWPLVNFYVWAKEAWASVTSCLPTSLSRFHWYASLKGFQLLPEASSLTVSSILFAILTGKHKPCSALFASLHLAQRHVCNISCWVSFSPCKLPSGPTAYLAIRY